MFDVEDRYFCIWELCFIVDFFLDLVECNKDIRRVFWILCCIFGESLFDLIIFLVFSLIEVRELLLWIVWFLESKDDNDDNDDKCFDWWRNEVFDVDGFFLLILNGVLKIDSFG